MRKIFFVTIFVFMISTAYGADVYTWTDGNGVAHFTDDLDRVPRSYQGKVEVMGYPSEGVPGEPSQVASRLTSKREEVEKVNVYGQSIKGEVVWEEKQEKEGPKVDLLGQDESYWRSKVRPWEDRLEEATVNYCGAQEEFMRIAEELSQMRFGSPTQYKMKIAELDDVKYEMQKYQGQITEAKEALEKISKEAREARANPDWLK